MLTIVQEAYYNSFERAIQENKCLLFSSEQRAWGKTYILNELGFNLQALEYKVFLLSEHMNHQEHFATDYIDLNRLVKSRGIRLGKLVVIVDEYRFSKMGEIFEYRIDLNIPMVGFVDYRY